MYKKKRYSKYKQVINIKTIVNPVVAYVRNLYSMSCNILEITSTMVLYEKYIHVSVSQFTVYIITFIICTHII